MRAQGKIPSWLKGFPALLREAGYYTSNNAKTDYNSPDPHQADVGRVRQDGPLAQAARRADSRSSACSTTRSRTRAACFPSRDGRSDFTPTDPAKVRIPPYQPDTPEMRADWARYYDHLTLMDGQIAAKLKDLADAGLAENTIVFYYSDNGGVLPRSKRFLQESGTHVPLIVYFPPKWRHLAPAPPGSRIKEPVSFVDFAPTVLSLAGVRIPDYMQGRAFAGPAKAAPNEFVFLTRDRMDERYDMMRSVADDRWLYIHNYRPDLPYVQPLEYMFQARGYQSWARVAREGKLTPATAQFWGEKPTEELYDMQADPDNVQNLAGDPAHRATLDRMRAALKERVLEIKDNGFLPEGSPLEGYDASRQPGAYPVEQVFALANLASERNPANLPRLIAGARRSVAKPSAGGRRKAARCCARKPPPAETALRQRLEDPSGAVQVAAAEALARLGQDSTRLCPCWNGRLQNAEDTVVRSAGGERPRPSWRSARPSLPALREDAPAVRPGKPTRPVHCNIQRRICERMIAVLEGQALALVYPSIAP